MKIPENTQVSEELWRDAERAKELTPDESFARVARSTIGLYF